MLLHFYFPFKASPENERERERERARERRRSSPRLRAPAPVRRRDRRQDHDRAVDRDLAKKARSQSRRDRGRRTENISGINDFFFLGCGLWLVFSDLCFPSSFPNTRKYFPENFLKCNQTHENIFLFRKLAFPKNMYFPENVLQQPNTALMIYPNSSFVSTNF